MDRLLYTYSSLVLRHNTMGRYLFIWAGIGIDYHIPLLRVSAGCEYAVLLLILSGVVAGLMHVYL